LTQPGGLRSTARDSIRVSYVDFVADRVDICVRSRGGGSGASGGAWADICWAPATDGPTSDDGRHAPVQRRRTHVATLGRVLQRDGPAFDGRRPGYGDCRTRADTRVTSGGRPWSEMANAQHNLRRTGQTVTDTQHCDRLARRACHRPTRDRPGMPPESSTRRQLGGVCLDIQRQRLIRAMIQQETLGTVLECPTCFLGAAALQCCGPLSDPHPTIVEVSAPTMTHAQAAAHPSDQNMQGPERRRMHRHSHRQPHTAGAAKGIGTSAGISAGISACTDIVTAIATDISTAKATGTGTNVSTGTGTNP
jgi:hypothetical protein